MAIKFYNTLDHKIEDFKSINAGEVKMYTCGPTVYDYAHIGNLSAYIRADILKRIFIYCGYKVKHVINITDVGHLTSDADTGEDKLEKGAKREGKTACEVARFFEDKFKQDIKKLNILSPDVFCRATEHIQEQLAMVQELEKKEYTYRTKDGIYFDTSKIKNYGELANIKAQQQIAGARVEFNPEKKNVTDFALWKFEPVGENRQMIWPSPWEKRTFPGWHIECSAMSIKYLGDHFDVHTGGVDHIGVHHSNEIAQNEAATGHKVVNYWVHFDHILFEGHKLSKSTGGFITLDTFIDKKIDPLAFRYLILTSNYRHKLNFTWKSATIANESLKSIYSHIRAKITDKKGEIIKNFQQQFKKALENNLDTPKAITILWDVLKSSNKNEDIYATVLDFDRVLGLNFDKIKTINIPEDIIKMAKDMDEARSLKDWDMADKLRAEIEKLGFKVRNTEKGSIIEE